MPVTVQNSINVFSVYLDPSQGEFTSVIDLRPIELVKDSFSRLYLLPGMIYQFEPAVIPRVPEIILASLSEPFDPEDSLRTCTQPETINPNLYYLVKCVDFYYTIYGNIFRRFELMAFEPTDESIYKEPIYPLDAVYVLVTETDLKSIVLS